MESIDAPALPARLTPVDDLATSRLADEPSPRVLLVTEGTYPHAWGGVSTWCDALVTVLPDVRFHIVAIVAAPDIPPVFTVPLNVETVSTVPLWGVHDVKETWRGQGISGLRRSRTAVDARQVEDEFLPAFRNFLHGILGSDQTNDPTKLADAIHDLYRYLRLHDLRETLRRPEVWAVYSALVSDAYAASAAELLLPDLQLWELTTGLQWVTRWLYPLAAEIPQVDVVHAAMAGICTMVSVAAKREHGAGFLLTEHGVYLRERYIADSNRDDSFFLKMLGLRFARRMTELTYALADQISPCCDYNGRWERQAGARPDQLQTIYYGVDSDAFSVDLPVAAKPHRVVWVGRINPLKDVETLLRAAAETLAVRPDVEFLLYGTAPDADADYHRRCLELHTSLGLGDSVRFCGYTDDPAKAFLSGDVVVLSSISEGFPYSTLEAMLCGRPVVATSVGGLPEQIKGVGTVVEPRNPTAMAAALVDLLSDGVRCAQIGAAARERAMGEFGHAKFRRRHHSSYLSLSFRHSRWQPAVARPAAVESLPPVPAPVTISDQATYAALLLDVEARVTVPMDSLEVAAVIESIGVTDQQARLSYGEDDVFSLAHRLFESIRRDRPARGVAERGGGGPVTLRRGGGFFDAARHPSWSLLPSIVLLLATWTLSRIGHWSSARVLALALGMSAGMLSTNGLALALGRRASVALSLGKIVTARQFFLTCLLAGVAFAAAFSTSLSFVQWRAVDFLSQQRPVFISASVVLAVIWLCAAGLSLVAASGFAALALAAGLALTLGLSYALVPVTPYHLILAIAAGAITSVGLMLWVLARCAQALAQKQTGLERLPSAGYLVSEGLPYFAYGTLAAALFVSVHVVGWAYLGADRAAISTLELGLFLPMVPAVLAAGRAERGLRSFWEYAGELQLRLPAEDRASFGPELYRRYRTLMWSFAGHLVVNSLAAAAVIELLLRSHVVSGIISYTNVADVRILYVAGLFAYGLMGLAQFSSMFALSFLQHRGPLRSLLAGIVVAVVAAVIVTPTVGYQYLAAALAGGALVYAVDSFLAVRPLLAKADQYYVSAV